MYTDWILMQRAAAELAAALRGSRVQNGGRLADGRFALECWRSGRTSVVAFDVFAPTPLVTLESAQFAIEAEPGFVRRAGTTLRGMTLVAVRSRKGDRVLRFDFGTRSRFGVTAGATLVAELVPKFGNLIVLKDDVVVTALKEFSPAENDRRSIEIGARYEPPPLARPEPIDDGAFALRYAQTADTKERAKALRAARPLLPPLLADSIVRSGAEPRDLLNEADAVLAAGEAIATLPVFAYRAGGRLVQAHVFGLRQFAHAHEDRTDALLPLFAQARAQNTGSQQTDRAAQRRRALARDLDRRAEKLRAELEAIDAGAAAAAQRDGMREAGERIFATLHELPPHERDEAKERATEFFERYKKAAASVPHIEERRERARRALDAVAELRWEVERSADADLDDVEDAVAALGTRPRRAAARLPSRKRKPLSVQTANGSRILIGRNPLENAELTFRIARPSDLWFHAQKIPGAHVILQRDDRQAPGDDDIEAAAAYAAFFSKAKHSPLVTIDYTQRKYVRKQPAAPPGLVFYTHPKSIAVAPRDPATTS